MASWTDKEEKYLRNNYRKKSLKSLVEELDRSKSSIKCKASSLNITKDQGWSQKEVQFLKNNYGPKSNMTAKEIAQKLDRSLDSVQNKIKYEDLSYVQQKSFTEQEIEYLKNNYKHMTHEELAKELDRDKQTITQRLNIMDLIKTPTYSEKEKDFIKNNWQDLSDHQMADELDRSVVSTRKKRRAMGLKRDTFVNTEKHWDWEETCEKVAKDIYDGVKTQKVFDNGLRPDIYVEGKNLVIDAKTSCYRGLNDLEKYYDCKKVEKVVVWSMRPVEDTKNAVKVLDINDLQSKVHFDVKNNLKDKVDSVEQKKVVEY